MIYTMDRIAIPLCGGNIDITMLGRVIERGLAADRRLVSRVYICTCIYYIYVYIYTCICVCIMYLGGTCGFIYLCVFLRIAVWSLYQIYICICIHAYIYMYTYIYINIYIYIYIYVYIYTHIYIYIHICVCV